MRTCSVLVVGAMAATLVGSCAEPPPDDAGAATQRPPERSPPDGPQYPSSRLAPGLLEIRPATTSAGESVELHFTERTGRGRVYALERQRAEGWQWVFSLTSDVHSSTWWYAGHDVATPDDVHYDTTVTVPVPPPAEPGDYRICASTGDCAEVTIE